MNEKPSWDQAPPRAKFLALTDAGWGFFDREPEQWHQIEFRRDAITAEAMDQLTRSTAIGNPLATAINTALRDSHELR